MLGFHLPVPATISWTISHLEVILHLTQLCPPAPTSPSILKPQPFLPHLTKAFCRDKLLSWPSPPRLHRQSTFQASSFLALSSGWAPFSSSPTPPPLLSSKAQLLPTSSSASGCSSFLWPRQPQTLWLHGTPSHAQKHQTRALLSYSIVQLSSGCCATEETCNACHPLCHRQHRCPNSNARHHDPSLSGICSCPYHLCVL